MRAETYLNAYCRCRDKLERHRLGGRGRKRLVRQERKLELRLRSQILLQSATYDELLELYERTNLERKVLWVAVLLQLAAFLVLLGRMLGF